MRTPFIYPAEVFGSVVVVVGVQEWIHGCAHNGSAFAYMAVEEDDGWDPGQGRKGVVREVANESSRRCTGPEDARGKHG